MAILNPLLMPTVGSPSVIVLPYRGKNMTQEDFYKQQKDAGSPVDQTLHPDVSDSQFTNKPMTGDLIKASLEKYAQRAAPPALEPGARVRNADTSKTQPDNFKSFYDMLGSITEYGNQSTAAETARAAYRRQQELNAIANQQVAGFNMPVLANGGGSYQGGIPSNPAANFKFAQQIAPNYGWDANQLAAWYRLGMKESGWRNTAQNPHSTAYGIGQFLDSTWAGYGIGKTSDPALQVEAMARYIRARYGTPANALAFHNAHNWY